MERDSIIISVLKNRQKLYPWPVSFLFVMFCWYFIFMSMVTNDLTERDVNFNRLKKIYLWNSPHRIESAAFGVGYETFLANECPVTDCVIVANSSTSWKSIVQSRYKFLETFDAVLVSVHELWLSFLPPEYYQRPRYQRFVLLTQESPMTMSFQPELYDNFFNWTMSYRRDSDIQLLYGRFITSNSTNGFTNRTEELITRRKKTKKVAWMVSHCHTASKREEYVHELQKHIQVDIYGGCGTFQCARNATHWLSEPECYVNLAQEYKFYLSFENSICQDYVTEKFFNILQHDMVPVVLGGADYSAIAPPHSYIDTAWFSSPADLATYLLDLDNDDDRYDSFFNWKTQFTVEAGVVQMARHAFCDLCAKLHQPEEQFTFKSYSSLLPQWSAASTCNSSKS